MNTNTNTKYQLRTIIFDMKDTGWLQQEARESSWAEATHSLPPRSLPPKRFLKKDDHEEEEMIAKKLENILSPSNLSFAKHYSSKS